MHVCLSPSLLIPSSLVNLVRRIHKSQLISYDKPIEVLFPRWILFSALLVAQFALVSILCAQEYRGLIIGRVTDPSGAVVSNANITARGPQQTYSAKTNNNGDFTIPFVQPGVYDVTAEAQGFKREQKQGVNIDVSQKVNLNFSLQVGTTGEEVRWGNVFIEAAACGRPVVVGDSGGAPESLVDGETGLCVDGRRVEAVADAVVTLLADPRLARKMGEAGRARVVRSHAWPTVAARLAGWLRAAAG